MLASIDDLLTGPRSNRSRLAELLWRLKADDKDEFRALLERHKKRRRQVYYLVGVWERFRGSRALRSALADIGWTKASIIAEHCALGEEKYAIGLARHHTAKDLTAILRDQKKPITGMRTVLLRFTPRQYAVLSKSLCDHGAIPAKRAYGGRGLSGQEAAILRLARAAGRVNSSKRTKT